MKKFLFSGGDRPAVISYIENGELCFGGVTFCKDYVSDADEATRRLLDGQMIKLQQVAGLFRLVQHSVVSALLEREMSIKWRIVQS